MLPIIWLEAADDDLARIIGHIGEIAPQAAVRLWDRISTSVLLLAEHPYLHQLSDRVPGLREIVVTANYVVLYRVTATAVEIVAVVHAAQHFPE